MFKPKKFLSLLLSIIVIVSPLLSPLSASAAYNKAAAQSYLLAHPNSPWSTMALAAINTNSIPSDYLKTISGTTAVDYEAPILAITALGKDPKTFGASDYVAKLESFRSNGQIGDATTLNDDIFGILALISAGQPVSDPAVADAKTFLLARQNSDGGWGFSTAGGSDSNTTASAIVALKAAGLSSDDVHIASALTYLKTTQNADGGFTYDPTSKYGTDSDSSSTAWVLWALNSLAIDQSSWTKGGHVPTDYLQDNQNPSGYFSYQTGSAEDSFSGVTTAYAVIALVGKTLPISVPSSPPGGGTKGEGAIFPFRIEGSADTVCTGKAPGPTALDIVKNAAVLCGFTYHIKTASFGSYLDIINSDSAAGLTGWLYLVNNISPDIGAGDYSLKTGDQVLWYFGEFGWQPTRLSLDKTQITSGQSSQTTVETFNSKIWIPLSGATVAAGTTGKSTDDSGHANITNQDGYYKVLATKTGYIRSNSVLLQIGQPSSGSVSLSANVALVDGTSTPPSSISFSVSPNTLDFGTVAAGQSSGKTVVIKNTGTTNIHVESIVSGDDIFANNLTLNNLVWQMFKIDIIKGQSQGGNLKLTVPNNYSVTGQKKGQIIFWASPGN